MKVNIKNIAKFASKAVKLFFATHVPEHIIFAVWTLSWMKRQRVNGHALIAKSMAQKIQMLTKKMNTWNSVVYAKKAENCYVATHARVPII